MDIKDVKVGDRCWVACYDTGNNDGQNAIISKIDYGAGLVWANLIADGKPWTWNLRPGLEVFWTKPEAPPKPKRKVTKTFTGWLRDDTVETLKGKGLPMCGDTLRTIEMWETYATASPNKVTITVEVDE